MLQSKLLSVLNGPTPRTAGLPSRVALRPVLRFFVWCVNTLSARAALNAGSCVALGGLTGARLLPETMKHIKLRNEI